MTSERDIERVLDHWFTERPTQVADRVLDEVAERIGREPQQPARLPWRDTHVIGNIKPLAAIAAVVVVAIVGFAVLRPPSGSNVGTGPTPSAVASPTTSPTPSPTPVSITSTNRMVVQQKPISWTAVLPDGWTNEGWFVTPSQGTEGPTGIAVGAPGAINVPSDPCDGVGKVSDSKTPDDVVAALESRTDLVISNKVDTTLGGYAGKRVDIQAPADLSACTDLYIIMAEPGGAGYHVQGPSEKIRMWIVDVEGQPIVIQITSFPGTPSEDVAAAEQIADSIVIEP
jgi:hypothetical protein